MSESGAQADKGGERRRGRKAAAVAEIEERDLRRIVVVRLVKSLPAIAATVAKMKAMPRILLVVPSL